MSSGEHPPLVTGHPMHYPQLISLPGRHRAGVPDAPALPALPALPCILAPLLTLPYVNSFGVRDGDAPELVALKRSPTWVFIIGGLLFAYAAVLVAILLRLAR